MGNTIIKAYKDNLNFHHTLAKLHFIASSNFGKVYSSKNDSTFSKTAFYRSPQTLPKLHFTAPWNFGKVYPSKNWFKLFQSCILLPSQLCQSCILRPPRTLAKFIHPKM